MKSHQHKHDFRSIISKLVTCCIFFFYIGSACCQEKKSRIQVAIDSVQQLLGSSSLPDTIRTNHLNNLARICFHNSEFERGLNALAESQQLARKIKYDKADDLYWIALSDFHVYTEMEVYYEQKFLLGNAAYDEYDWASDADDGAYDKPHMERIMAALLATLSSVEKTNNKEMVAHILLRAGQLSVWLGKYEEAISYLDRGTALFRQMKSPVALFGPLQKLFIAYSKDNNNTEIQPHLAEINAIMTAVQDFRESSLVLLTVYGGSIAASGLGKKTKIFEMQLLLNSELEQSGDTILHIISLENLAVQFAALGMAERAIEYYKHAVMLRDQKNYYTDAVRIYFNLGFELIAVKQTGEARQYFDRALQLARQTYNATRVAGSEKRYADAMGQILMDKGQYNEALAEFAKSFPESFYILYYEANCYFKLGNFKESQARAEKSTMTAVPFGDQRLLTKLYLLLADVYDTTGQFKKSHEYLKKYRDLVKEKEENDIANYSANFEIQKVVDKSRTEREKLQAEKLLKEKQNQNQRLWLFSIAGALLSAFALLFILLRNNRAKQKANTLLQQQKEEIQSTLSQLKSAQAQLIQSEKMASLGQLTAGIAHEIQNPLNFVNNFSEINGELINELVDEVDKDNKQDAKAIAQDIKQNLEKINHHGKRADAIVKGMLQHSRISTGQKEPTDINALVDEYLRLAYHGIRAKDSQQSATKNFNASIKTDLDNSIGKINITPQDIGKVLLNLYNNAFDAVREKAASYELRSASGGYEPLVSVQTKKMNGKIEIRVTDNGNGIPQNIVDKIFQPFFTTKPTGQGTGLGLSLAYDIVKAHGGEITVNPKEGTFTEFTIVLPLI